MFKLRNLALSSLIISGSLLLSSLGLSAHAMNFFETHQFTGDEAKTKLTFTDMGDGKTVQVKIDVLRSASGNIGDLRGVFFNIKDADNAFLNGLEASYITGVGGSASDTGITKTVKDQDNVSNLGNGVNLTGGGQSYKFDVGYQIGKDNGNSLNTSATLSLFHADGLTMADFADESIGIRLKSVGSGPNGGGGSSKLQAFAPENLSAPEQLSIVSSAPGPVDIPEPTALVALGFMGLGFLKAKRKPVA